MSSITYDMDTTSGLMPEIQRLLSPPTMDDSGGAKKRKDEKSERRYIRRPGRTVNHDCCDSCKEGGDLICCDRCPAAFHLLCHDPPLTDEDLPIGEWICHNCKTSPENNKTGATGDCQSTNCGNQSSQSSENSDSAVPSLLSNHSDDLSSMEIDEDKAHALNALITAASSKNPVQFQLPRELSCPLLVPGSSKRFRSRDRQCKKQADSDNSIVHLPAKVCSRCNRGCRKQALIQCDYCPQLFHTDCVDPPLTTLPRGHWRCPNHSEILMDEKIVPSQRLSERIKLYDLFTGPVAQDAIKVKYFRKMGKTAPPFRCKRKLPQRLKLQVPEAIRRHYENRNVMIPHVRDTLMISGSVTSPEMTFTLEEQNEWVSTIAALQSGLVKDGITPQNSFPNYDKSESKPNISKLLETNPNANKIIINNSVHFHSNKTMPTFQNGPCHDTNGEVAPPFSSQEVWLNNECHNSKPGVSSVPPRTISVSYKHPNTGKPNNITPMAQKRYLMKNPPITSQCATASISQARVATVPPSNVISTPSIKNTNANDKTKPQFSEINAAALTKLYSSLQSSINGFDNLDLSKMDEKMLHMLAFQRLQQIFSERKPPEQQEEKKPTDVQNNASMSFEIRGRAILSPLHMKGPPVEMAYRSLHLGLGSNMDINFENYGHCNYISAKHASIFYDEVTRHYELLNYSCYGTHIDNVLYSCDVSEKKRQSATTNTLSSAVRRLNRSLSQPPEAPTMPQPSNESAVCSREKQHKRPCRCNTYSSSTLDFCGWEGTAVLHHGSHIRCGCLHFVFSITEYGAQMEQLNGKDSLLTFLNKGAIKKDTS